MKVMSYNIRYGSANDGENSWSKRKDICLDVIEKQNPDIIGLQEVENFQLKDILDRFPSYAFVGTSRKGNIDDGEINPILFKMESLYSTQSGTFWLSDTPNTPASKSYGNRLPRICTWSEFKKNDSNETFYFLNTHLDHESKVARAKGSKQIIEFVGNKEKVILTGDFNCESEKSDEVVSFISNNFADSYRAVNPNEKNSGTFHSFTGKPINVKIDYIFVRGFEVINSTIIKDHRNGMYPSDHFPIDALLR